MSTHEDVVALMLEHKEEHLINLARALATANHGRIGLAVAFRVDGCPMRVPIVVDIIENLGGVTLMGPLGSDHLFGAAATQKALTALYLGRNTKMEPELAPLLSGYPGGVIHRFDEKEVSIAVGVAGIDVSEVIATQIMREINFIDW